MQGAGPGWCHWDRLPPALGRQPATLLLQHPDRASSLALVCGCANAADDAGLQLSLGGSPAPTESGRFSVPIRPGKHLKGISRYDSMTQPFLPIKYTRLETAGHLTFTSTRLVADLRVIGAPVADLWLESSVPDCDIFVYLVSVGKGDGRQLVRCREHPVCPQENYDPQTGRVCYVTEGMCRASHRAESSPPDPKDPRSRAVLPGHPFHTHMEADALPMPQGRPAQLRFAMLPTAFTFEKGTCIRLAFAGCDTKHFVDDALVQAESAGWLDSPEWRGKGDPDGGRQLWIHTSDSKLVLPVV